MNTPYEQMEQIAAQIIEEKRAAHAERLAQRQREAKLEYEEKVLYFREFVCAYHVFVRLNDAPGFFLVENKLSENPLAFDFRDYIENPDLYHCIVRGKRRANTVARYVLDHPVAVLSGKNVIQLAFEK